MIKGSFGSLELGVGKWKWKWKIQLGWFGWIEPTSTSTSLSIKMGSFEFPCLTYGTHLTSWEPIFFDKFILKSFVYCQLYPSHSNINLKGISFSTPNQPSSPPLRRRVRRSTTTTAKGPAIHHHADEGPAHHHAGDVSGAPPPPHVSSFHTHQPSSLPSR